MKSISPVFGLAQVRYEKVMERDAAGKPLFHALPLDFVVNGKAVPGSGIAVRLRLNDEDRAIIAAGGDLLVTEMAFGRPFVPFNIQICKEGQIPTY